MKRKNNNSKKVKNGLLEGLSMLCDDMATIRKTSDVYDCMYVIFWLTHALESQCLVNAKQAKIKAKDCEREARKAYLAAQTNFQNFLNGLED